MNPLELIYEAGALCIDALLVLGRIFRDPRRAAEYCRKCGLPPLEIETDWVPRAQELREQLELENAAQTMSLVLVVIDELRGAVAAGADGWQMQLADVLRRLLVGAMLVVLYRNRRKKYSFTLFTIVFVLVLVDTRLQEALSTTLAHERWIALLRGMIDEGRIGNEVKAVGGVAAGTIVAYYLARKYLREKASIEIELPNLQYGFDHPDMLGLEETLDAARHTFVLFAGGPVPFGAGGYLDFDPPQAPWHHRPFALAVTPLRHIAGEHQGAIHVAGRGSYRWDIGETMLPGWTGEFTLAADGGMVIAYGDDPPLEGSPVTGGLSLDANLTYTTPDITDTEGDARTGVSVRVRRSSFTMRGAGQPQPLVQLDLRLDGIELNVGKVPVLEWILPAGFRVAFDAGARWDTVDRALRLRGSVGGELVIPLDLVLRVGFGDDADRVTLLEARARSVRVAFKSAGDFERPGEGEPGRAGGYHVELTANLSVELFDILTVHADGAGLAFTAGTTDDGRGNLAGIANLGWQTLWPSGFGIELAAWKLRGGGWLAYDAATERLGGAVEIAVGSWFQLKGVGLVEPTPGGSGRSWVAVGSIELPRGSAWGPVRGLGVIYASDRTTDPQAFLDGVGSGDLDAILFPEDPVANAAAYVGVLGRMFPAAAGSEVMGGLVRLSFFGGLLLVDFGMLIEGGTEQRLYMVARGVAVYPDESTAVVRVQADGVAVWDGARDEFQLRVALRNSRALGGELTGEAMMFKGDPDREDGVTETATLFSIGGFHPAYAVPGAAIHVPKRVAVVVARGDHLRIDGRFYMAFTPGAFHLGVEAQLQARVAGFGIRARLGLDMLIGKEELNCALRASVEIQLGSRTLCGASFEGTLTGYGPTLLCGRACFKALFWEICTPPLCLELEFGDNLQPPAPDVAAQLEAAVRDPRNWDSGGAPGLSLRPAEREGVWLSPSAPLRFSQRVVPLNRTITRYDGGKLPAPAAFDVEAGVPAGWTARSLYGEFAPVTYFDLTPEQRLAARALESLPAGFTLTPGYETGEAWTADGGYEPVIIDSTWRAPSGPRDHVVIADAIVAAASSLAPGARIAFYTSPRRSLRMSAERLAVLDEEVA